MTEQTTGTSKFNFYLIIGLLVFLFIGGAFVVLSPSKSDSFNRNQSSTATSNSQASGTASFVPSGGVEADRPKAWTDISSQAKSIDNMFETLTLSEKCWNTMDECRDKFYQSYPLSDVKKIMFEKLKNSGILQFKIQCNGRSTNRQVEYNVSYTLPASWSDCNVYVFGEKGRSVRLRLYY